MRKSRPRPIKQEVNQSDFQALQNLQTILAKMEKESNAFIASVENAQLKAMMQRCFMEGQDIGKVKQQIKDLRVKTR